MMITMHFSKIKLSYNTDALNLSHNIGLCMWRCAEKKQATDLQTERSSNSH